MGMFEGVCAVFIWDGLDLESTMRYQSLMNFFTAEGGIQTSTIKYNTTHVFADSWFHYDHPQDLNVRSKELEYGRHEVVCWQWLHACQLAGKLIPGFNFTVPLSGSSSAETFEKWQQESGTVERTSNGDEKWKYVDGKDMWESGWRLGMDRTDMWILWNEEEKKELRNENKSFNENYKSWRR